MNKWALVALLWVAALLNYLDRQVIFSLFPLLRADLGLSDAQLGLVGAAFLWVYALASPFAGFAADRWGHKPVIIASLMVWSMVTFATGQATNLTQLLAARAVMGVSEAFYLPAALALIASQHGSGTRSLATGLHYSGIYVGVVAGGAGGGWLGATYGWRFPFVLLGAAGLLYSAVLFLLPSSRAGEPAPNPPPFLTAMRSLVRTPGFPSLAFVFGTSSVAGWLIYAWMPAYLYERFGMSLAEAGFNATFYIQAASVAGVLAGGALGDRWSRLGAQVAALAVAAPFLFVAGFTSIPFFLLGGLAMYGLGRGAYDANNMPVVCQIVPPALRATAYGILNMVGTFAGGMIAFGAGALKEALGIGVMLQLAAGLLLIGAWQLYRVRRVTA